MGIRVVCPNGHRLHLKAQLIGRRGLCPDCGARFRIPNESSEVPQPFAEPPTRRAGSEELANQAVPSGDAHFARESLDPPGSTNGTGGAQAHAALPIQQEKPGVAANPGSMATPGSMASLDDATPPTAAPAVPVSQPAAPPAPGLQPTAAIPGSTPAATSVPGAVSATPVSATPASVAAPQATGPAHPPAMPTAVAVGPPTAASVMASPVAPAAGMPAGGDLLSQAPNAVWYVQPPTGGRYGPAKPEVVRQWIAEGRVTESCMVWRDGWSEWQSASTILGSGSMHPSVPQVGGAAEIRTTAPGSLVARNRKRSKGLGISVIVILGLACVGLMILFAVLLSNGVISFSPSTPAQ